MSPHRNGQRADSVDFSSLIAGAGNTAWTVVFFVVALSVIVAVHEYGHYIVGRWSGIHAEVFSLGFGPVLFSRVDKHGTRWQLAALPLGGYVKFLGDKDAASAPDAEVLAGLSAAERRHTMSGAPLWARAATVAAGPVFNFVLALVVYIGMITYSGVATDLPMVGKLMPTPFQGATLVEGDQVLALNGTATPDLATYIKVGSELPPAATVTYKVDRNGQALDVQGPHPFLPIVGAVHPQNAAMAAGIKVGDVILSAGGTAVTAFSELPPLVEATAGAPIDLKIWRAGAVIDLTLTPNRRDIPKADGSFETRWLVGLSGGLLFDPETRRAGVLETVTLAVEQTWFVAKASLSGLWHVVTGAISSCNISGPIGMAEVMGDAARSGPEVFLGMLAALSMGIGLLNLFPIPVLDGGHLMFYAYEAVVGKAPSTRVLGVLMTAGLALVLSFMAFALSNDFFCS
jgi:regulator of sigma E protease